MDAYFKNNVANITDDLNEQSELIINNIVKVFLELRDENKRNDIDFSKPAELTAMCCGVSLSKVKQIHFKYNTQEYDLHRMRSKPVNNIDDIDKSAIRDIVTSNCENGKFPSIMKILNIAKEQLEDFKCSVSSLRSILTELGFEYKRTSDGRKKLVEKKSLVNARLEFLRRMDELKKAMDTRPRIYLDEIWISRYLYKVRTSETHLKRGRKYIVCHAGSAKSGFIDNAEWIFRTKKTYGKNNTTLLTAKAFKEWFLKLLQGLEEPTIIIMDNAFYHSKRKNSGPKSSSSKEEIEKWLQENGIAYPEKSLKEELLQIVKERKQKRDYVIDELANSYGHEVLRIPLYHSQYNAITPIWEKIRKEVDQKTAGCYREVDIEDFVYEAIRNVTKEDWTESVRKAEARQDEDLKKIAVHDDMSEDSD